MQSNASSSTCAVREASNEYSQNTPKSQKKKNEETEYELSVGVYVNK